MKLCKFGSCKTTGSYGWIFYICDINVYVLAFTFLLCNIIIEMNVFISTQLDEGNLVTTYVTTIINIQLLAYFGRGVFNGD